MKNKSKFKNIVQIFLPIIICIIAIWGMLYKVIFESRVIMVVAICSSIIIILLKILYEYIRNYSIDAKFKSKQNDMLKTYGFILTKLDAIPNIKEYTYYKYEDVVQIIGKAMDSRVNIYYVYDDNTCDYFLIDQGSLYVYTIKKNPRYFSRIDKYFVDAQRAV